MPNVSKKEFSTILESLIESGTKESLSLARQLMLDAWEDSKETKKEEKDYEPESVEFPDSSFIRKAQWKEGVLSVWLKSGNVYNYTDVPLDVFDEFSDCASAGEFYNDNIKGQYDRL